MGKISDRLPNVFWEAAERGSTVTLRIMAPHYTGGGEVVAKGLDLHNAMAIAAAVNNFDALADLVRVLPDEYAVNSGEARDALVKARAALRAAEKALK